MMIKCTRVEFAAYSDQPHRFNDIYINKYQIKYLQDFLDVDNTTVYTEVNLDRGSIIVTEPLPIVLSLIEEKK
jgi:hypothetical protein